MLNDRDHMTTAKFKDVLQCIDGTYKGAIAQVMGVLDNGEVTMLHRALLDGTPTFFNIRSSEAASWKYIGIAVVGPQQKALEPESQPPVSVVAPEQSPTAPLKIEELLEPLPPNVKVVPMNAEPETPSLDWGSEEPETEPAPPLPKQRQQRKNGKKVKR